MNKKCKDSDVYKEKSLFYDSDQDSEVSETAADEEFYDSDKDPAFPQSCEVRKCKKEVWAACHKCLTLVCWEHFNEEVDSCKDHGLFKIAKKTKMLNDLVLEVRGAKKAKKTKTSEVEGGKVKKSKLTELPAKSVVEGAALTTKLPEEYFVEGASKETPQNIMTRQEPKHYKQSKKKRDKVNHIGAPMIKS